ncbi:MAG: ABC transporter permease [Bacteroidales bacterium]|jgi:ABC-type antimicrobial peptide transport system permease subunit|nr:ABC transporter permease [Bacteroidales bacterium]
MKKFIIYFQPAFYNIQRNKPYAVFCIGGTAVTFIFVVLILQLVYIFTGNYPPISNADKIIRLSSFQNAEGKDIGGIWHSEVNAFSTDLKSFDCISLYHDNHINVEANGRLHFALTGFVNADFWKVYDFDFLYGRAFTKEECSNRKPVAIITESMSQAYFNTKNGTGKKITFQGNEYEITGVVKNISYFSTPTGECTVWVPYVFDKFIPNGTYTFTIDVLTPPSMSMNESKEHIAKTVQYYYENKNIQVNFPPQKVKTLKETMATKEGDLFQYGSMMATVLFLLIPALNMLSLGRSHTNNRTEEIAVRRTFGAGRFSSFLQIMTENFLLVLAGSVTGLLLAMPVMKVIQQTIMNGSVMENLCLVEKIDYAVIFAGVLPAMFVFSLLSGGLPAYMISKGNVAHVLKGGSK